MAFASSEDWHHAPAVVAEEPLAFALKHAKMIVEGA